MRIVKRLAIISGLFATVMILFPPWIYHIERDYDLPAGFAPLWDPPDIHNKVDVTVRFHDVDTTYHPQNMFIAVDRFPKTVTTRKDRKYAPSIHYNQLVLQLGGGIWLALVFALLLERSSRTATKIRPATKGRLMNARCPFCKDILNNALKIVACAQCGSLQHAGCWLERGKCSIFSCESTTSRAIRM